MALTRKFLSAMGIEADKVDEIITAHVEVVDGLKAERDSYKADADQLKGVQKELDKLKEEIAKNDDGETALKADYDKLKQEFDSYKADITEKEAKAAKETAVRAYYESKNITGKNLEIAMRGSRAEIDGIEIADGKIKDTAALDTLIGGDFAGLVSTTTTKGANTANPPTNNGGGKITKADIYKKDDKGKYVMTTAERQKALAENPELLS